MERPTEILPTKGIESKTGAIEEIQDEWIQPNSMAMFEDYSEQFSDDFPNLNQWFFQEWGDDSGNSVPGWNSLSDPITEKGFPELIFQDGADDPPLVSGTVELTEEDVLPAGKTDFSPDDRNCFRGADQSCLEVGVPIPVLLVMQPDSPGNEFL